MSPPIANFGFSRTALQVDFKNLTLNKEGSTTYSWDFGDGTSLNTTENPSHTYAAEGFFNVSLTSKTGTDEHTISMAIGVGSITSILNTSVLSLTSYYLPSTLLSNTEQLVSFIQTQQMYLQPLVENPLVVAGDTHNEYKWPALVNKLIAMMVAKEVILKEANIFLATMASEGGSSTTTESTEEDTTRSVKSIETGPSKVEWYEASTAIGNSEVIKNIGASFHQAMANGGIIDKLQEAICSLSKRLSIFLPDCGPLPINPTAFKIGSTPKVGSVFNSSIALLEEDWEANISW